METELLEAFDVSDDDEDDELLLSEDAAAFEHPARAAAAKVPLQ